MNQALDSVNRYCGGKSEEIVGRFPEKSKVYYIIVEEYK